VDLINENTLLYDMRRCGNKYFRLWCVYCVPCCVRRSHTTRHTVHTPQHEILVATMPHIT